ncbi:MULTISPECIES: hypothetical protein [Echinicola]|nr:MULTISPECIES: hypothetical protein [Echinicola]
MQVLDVKKLKKWVGKEAGMFDELLNKMVIGGNAGGVCLHECGL